MHADETRTNELSERIIDCAFPVLNTLGTRFLEKVYENALAHELREVGLSVAQQQGIAVYFNGIVVGEYVAELVVEKTVVIELKASKTLDAAHCAIRRLFASNRPAALPAAELRQAPPGKPPCGPRSLNPHRLSACICGKNTYLTLPPAPLSVRSGDQGERPD